ncbi:3-phenylpropionate/trans-cinnamate dioxygenase ferredoxin reductase subunit [Mycobacteroides chelonae]|nr:3-phenylpropionate/trans-cinnamate dioxygenase ferredoxin reductase subunit [Mycobacteroides chelonae]
MEKGRAIIVGGSHAGAQLCVSLRQEGWEGEILVVGDEPTLPYHRPPLSKSYLSGKSSIVDLLIRPPRFYEQQNIDIRHARVEVIHRRARTITLDDGEEIGYDKLALCVGARPRRLAVEGAELTGVHYLRTVADVEAIRYRLSKTRRVVIIGAGYVGLETAASLRALGIEVTILESAERVLQRATAPEVSRFYARVHNEQGVEVLTGVSVVAIEGHDRVRGVRLAEGRFIDADLVIVGIGVIPNTELAEAAGISVDNGIVIDNAGLTNDPDIVAAGDCANYLAPRYRRRLRLESVPNAGEHAKVAAATLCGKAKTISALPWFWSDQYELKLQIAGLNDGYDELVLRGDPDAGRSFACFYLKQGEMIAADCINRPKEFMYSRRLIAERLSIDRELLADPERPWPAP